MLATVKQNAFQELVSGASHEELVWMNGFLAGVLSVGGSLQSAAGSVALATDPAPVKLTIVYGTETGNAKGLATRLAAVAKQQGVRVKLAGLDQYRTADLVKESYFVVVVSTQGDGDLPVTAVKFYEYLKQQQPGFSHLQFAVLALGDSSYPLFCKAGEDIDSLLEEKGARRFFRIQKCDTDYENDATTWFREALSSLTQTSDRAALVASSPAQTVVQKTGRKIYQGTVLSSVNLNDQGSAKETYHIEISAEGVVYEPGDALGVVPENPQHLVLEVLSLSGADPEKRISYKGAESTLLHLLKTKLNLVYLPERVVRKYAEVVQQDIPETRIGLVDLLKIYPVKDAAQFERIVEILEPVAPRLYSISSALSANEDEVHITVAKDRFEVNGETGYGLCSGFLSSLSESSAFSFYIHPNRQFRLPAPEQDVIMIGPGTGIAPFRSFLAERDAQMASGRNWLFFGDQHFVTDFLYQTELQNWFETGVLTRINTAFSRDQEEKVYVQHKMLAQAAELYSWLETGAYLYVCGAKEPMSIDVENTLLRIVSEQGGKTEDQAAEYIEWLKQSSRYLKDVY